MRIGLERVVPAIDHAERGQPARLLADLIEAVDIARRRACARVRAGRGRSRRHQAAGRIAAAPWASSLQLGPNTAASSTRMTSARISKRMQARNQRIDQGLVDDEGQIEIVRGLRDQMHVECTEFGEHGRKPVQHRAHAAPDQGDRRARRDHLDPAERLEIGAQARQHIGIEQVVGRIERDGHIGFGRADQVDRQAMPLEGLEHIGKKADLLPHADRFHRHQGDALARADRLDARRARPACSRRFRCRADRAGWCP